MHIIILNIIAVLLLSAAVVFPVMILGTGLTADFWLAVWPAGVVTVLALGGMNAYFIKNWRLFSLLKKEDWPALADYLEKKVCKEGKYTSRNIRLLTHSYIVLGDFESTARLENNVALAKPALLEEYALVFGAARILGGNTAVDFFKDRLGKGGDGTRPQSGRGSQSGHQPQSGHWLQSRHWLRWYYGFSLILARSLDEAQAVFVELAAEAKDTVVAGLSAYFLSEVLGKGRAECVARAKEVAGRVRKDVKSLDVWNTTAAKLEKEVHGVIIKRYIDEAGQWLFKGDRYEKN